MDLQLSRVQVLSSMAEAGFSDLIEIFIFKVDSHGMSTGFCTILCFKPEFLEMCVAGLGKLSLGAEARIRIPIDHSEEQEQRLSKERQMELNKIQRKQKKLLKFPKSDTNESYVELLGAIKLGPTTPYCSSCQLCGKSSDQSLDQRTVGQDRGFVISRETC